MPCKHGHHYILGQPHTVDLIMRDQSEMALEQFMGAPAGAFPYITRH